MHKKILLAEAYRIMHDIKAAHFSLAFPVVLKVSENKKFCKACCAMYREKSFTDDTGQDVLIHEIEIAFPIHWQNAVELANTLAHELGHCLQNEEKKALVHDRKFYARLDYVLFQIGCKPTTKQERKAGKASD